MRGLFVGALLAAVAATTVGAGDLADQFTATAGDGVSASFFVLDNNGGTIDLAGDKLDHTTPVRIASVTKTFVAATALRLVEEGKLDITQPINHYIDARFDELLTSDGYDTSAIRVKHLLSHTGGLVDHTHGKPFFDTLLADPTHHWTREEQVKGAVDWLDPLGEPGEKFSYSDTGYVLLGHIIEKQSGLSLAAAVRSYLALDSFDLKNTYWELVEVNTGAEARRAHQYFQGMDTHGWSATLDHYGGGGLVSTTEDMATFFSALFGGDVFKKEGTLDLMLSQEGLPDASPYRLGIFVYEVDGVTFYEHSGFWGTLAIYVPSQKRAIAGAVLHQKHFKAMRDAMVGLVTEGM
ncbi:MULTISPECIES: serine hydrolase domain-containing protein [Kordiimonas]|jgi:D-alanyl-D-alanine carboxypeptidase|uniref:serine hydrolase domain-containing protein n=1 Tax=Kordiimonas TaxID=288021 RepID=UPI002580F0F2|nr:serine hydrolase domain-containing protein [Kordiimonas sp. UBA4487]